MNKKSVNSKNKVTNKVFVKENDLIGDIISKYPESIPVLLSVGLHCIGCHVSVSESLRDGCLVHGLKEKDIKKLVNDINKKIIKFNNLPQVSFKKSAVSELSKRMNSKKASLVRIVNSFGGEFDFEPANKSEGDELIILIKSDEKTVSIALTPRIERILRGVEIGFDSKIKDFVANRVQNNSN